MELLEGHHGHGRDGRERDDLITSCAYHLNKSSLHLGPHVSEELETTLRDAH